ncbi:MAG: GH3 auxin-responsive promoter family protein, partial [Bacteroidales bacterium]|nr:GH3 auxin-responsive promoter family protein [Bacteroidales bacterium]
MNLINRIFLLYSKELLRELDQSRRNPMPYQEKWFKYLIENGKETAFGKEWGFDSIKTVKDFQSRVPVMDYNRTEPYINRLLQGEDYILWNSKVRKFAKSSGTSSNKSKFIPIPDDFLQINHYGGFKRMLATYVHNNPNTGIFKGKALTLGGSVAPDKSGRIMQGDLSAILLNNSPVLVEMMRTPGKEVALMGDFQKKLDAICRESSNINVTNFSGVPSWNLMLLNRVLEYTGKRNICDVWPNLELFMHGGIGFEPYRDIFRKLIPSGR